MFKKAFTYFICLALQALSINAQKREQISLNEHWFVKPLEQGETIPSDLPSKTLMRSSGWYTGDVPKQVQEFVFENGELPDPHVQDNAAQWVEVFEKDWLYVKRFKTPEFQNNVILCFDGLDTEVEVILNGENIAHCNNMFRRWKIPVSKQLNKAGKENLLVLKFIPPKQVIAEYETKYSDKSINSKKYIRKSWADFSSYLGARPHFLKMGIYDRVYLDVLPENYFQDVYITSHLSYPYEKATLNIAPNLRQLKGYQVEYKIYSLNNELIAEKRIEATHLIQVDIDKPELWWPMNYGDQALYRIQLHLLQEGRIIDESETKFGIRELQLVQKNEQTGEPLFGFMINNKMVFMNGANWAPLEGFTHVWNEQRADQLLKLAKLGNLNFIRVWGEGSIPSQSFFEKCNEYGIVVWMEFMSSAPLNQPLFDEGFVENFKAEVEDEIKRLRNHSCIAIWCGGNEHYLKFKAIDGDNTKPLGREFFQNTIPNLVAEFDPQRYFHPSSPWGNDTTWFNGNNPLVGDFHDYSTYRFQPMNSVPLFTTEACMVSPYALHNLKRFMSDDEIWPENFKFTIDKPGKKAWPPGWEKHSLSSSWEKSGRIQDYCDITSASDACRVFGTAHGEYIQERYERQRRGIPDGMKDGNRRSWGAAVWRLNDTWPMMYMSMVDYYLEPKIPYYFLKRACEPVLVSFERTQDEISVWLVNDSPLEIKDTLFVELRTFDGKIKNQLAINVALASSQSKRVINLGYEFYEIWKRNEYLVARFNQHVTPILLWPEKFLNLSTAQITAKWIDHELVLQSNAFVKDVELLLLNTSGAIFSDNYFHLLPNEEKRVKIVDSKHGNMLQIKGVNTEAIQIKID